MGAPKASVELGGAPLIERPLRAMREARLEAVVVAKPDTGLNQASLRAHCLDRLAGYKVPKTFELVDELPRTESGKVRRTELR